jgi:hypothetical protein
VNAIGTAVQTGGSVTTAAGSPDSRIGGGSGTGSADTNAVGTYDLLGGTFTATTNFQIGATGQGAMYVNGGTASTAGFPVVGRYPTGFGSLTVNAGSFTQSGTGPFMLVGEQGTGTLNVGGNGTSGGTVTVNGGQLRLGHANTGVGFANVGAGGTIEAKAINSALAGAVGVLNLHGG